MPYDVMLQWHLNPYFKKLEKLMLEINIPLRVVCTNVFKHDTVWRFFCKGKEPKLVCMHQ